MHISNKMLIRACVPIITNLQIKKSRLKQKKLIFCLCIKKITIFVS